jgi:epsilon-lactone hydrolase
VHAELERNDKMVVPGGDAVFLNIPYALSEETVKFLGSLNAPSFSTGIPLPGDVLGWSKLQQLVERHALPQSDRLVGCLAPAIAGFSFKNVPVLDVRPRNWKQERKVAIYTHGGGLTLFSAASTLNRAALFADDTALRVISVDYTLAPMATFEQITDQVVTAVQTVLSKGYRMADIIMLGEDSGAGVIVASILKLRNLGLKLPAAALLISPCLDLSAGDDTDYPRRPRPDSYLFNHLTAEADPRNTSGKWNVCLGSIYADFFQGFSPTLIQGSTQEIWLDKFLRLYHALKASEVQVRLDLYEGVPHGFQFAVPDRAESQVARRKIREFARVRLAQAEHPDTPEQRLATLEISKIEN